MSGCSESLQEPELPVQKPCRYRTPETRFARPLETESIARKEGISCGSSAGDKDMQNQIERDEENGHMGKATKGTERSSQRDGLEGVGCTTREVDLDRAGRMYV